MPAGAPAETDGATRQRLRSVDASESGRDFRKKERLDEKINADEGEGSPAETKGRCAEGVAGGEEAKKNTQEVNESGAE